MRGLLSHLMLFRLVFGLSWRARFPDVGVQKLLHPLHYPEPPRRQRQAVPADGGVFAGGVHRPDTSPHPPFHHLHMQPRRGQIHRGQAHIPCCYAHLVIRPDVAIQHKGNAAGIKRCIREIPPPRTWHRNVHIRRGTPSPSRHAHQDHSGCSECAPTAACYPQNRAHHQGCAAQW